MAVNPYYTYKPKVGGYKAPSFKTPTFNTPTPKQDTIKALQSQRDSLQKRLEAEGATPDDRNLLERALNLEQGQGFLMNFIEVLDRPGQTVKGALMSAAQGGDPITGAWEGLSGQGERITGKDFAQNVLGIDTKSMGGVGEFVVDVGVDILTDPLTYIPAGTFSKFFMGELKLTTEQVKVGEKLAQASNFSLKAGVDTTADLISRGLVEGSDDFVREYNILMKQKHFDNGMFWASADDATRYVDGTEAIRAKASKAEQDAYFHKRLLLKDYARKNGTLSPIFDPLKDLKKYAARRGGAGTAGELVYATDLGNYLDGLGISDDVVLIKGETTLADTLKMASGDISGDVTLAVRNADGSLTGLRNMEVKNLLEAKVDFSGLSMRVKNGALSISDGSVTQMWGYLKKNHRATYDKLWDMFNSQKKLSVGKEKLTFQNLIELIQNKNNKGLADFRKVLDANDMKVIDEFLEAVMPDYIHIANTKKPGQFLLYKTEDLLQIFDDKGIYRLRNKKSTRLEVGMDKLDLDVLEAAGIKNHADDFLADMLSDVKSYQAGMNPSAGEEMFKTVIKQERVGGVIPKIGQIIVDMTPPTVKELFAPVKKVIESWGYTFDGLKGFDAEAINAIYGIEGKVGTRLQTDARRLSRITENIIQANPGREKQVLRMINNIMESGAYIDDAGNLAYYSNMWAPKELMDNVIGNLEKGQLDTVIGFKNPQQIESAVKELNRMARQVDTSLTDDVFVYVNKNGSSSIRVKGDWTVKDLKALTSDVATMNSGATLDLGAVKLAKEEEAFFLANKDAIADYTKLRDSMVDTLVNEIGYDKLPQALQNRMGYMRHILSDDAAKGLAGMQQAARSKYYKEGVELLQSRKYIGTADEINKGLREFYGMSVDIFDVNVHNSLEDLIRTSMEALEQKELTQLILNGTDDAGERFFKIIDNTQDAAGQLPPKYKVLTDTLNDEFSKMFKNLPPEVSGEVTKVLQDLGFDPATKKIAMHKSAYGILQRVNKAYVDLPAFVKGYDKFMNYWKSITLVSPGFHMRNLFGNMSNMYLVGMDMPAQLNYYRKITMQMSDYRQVIDAIADGRALDDIAKQMPGAYENYKSVLGFYESGIAQTHRGTRDLDTIKEMLEKMDKNIGKDIVNLNFNVAENMDDFQRLALYQWAYDKQIAGGAEEMLARAKASEAVRNSLFDYSNLTGTERSIMKRLFPFYTFMKNNLVFQMKNIAVNPGAYARLGRAYNYAVEDLAGLEQGQMADYMSDNMWLPIPMRVTKDDKEAIAFLKLNLPFSDFTQFVENPFREGVGTVTAPIKIFWELGTGVDTFTGGKLKDFPGQKDRMEPGTGVLSGIRDSSGTLSLTGDPVIQNIARNMGLRVPITYASMILDAMDSVAGYQPGWEALYDAGARGGLVGIQTRETLDLTDLYQQLEELRNQRSRYEQETGQALPSLEALGLR